MSARILEVTEEEYFRDPCETPSLSQSIAKLIVDESPLHAWQQHPRLGGIAKPPTAATDSGHVIHKLMLGAGAEIEVLPFDDYRTKVAQAARDAARELGKIPVKQADYDECLKTADALRDRLHSAGYKFDGESELAFEWQEQGRDGPVLCRGRADHIKFAKGMIYDVKKIRSANPKVIAKHIGEYGYGIQKAAYTSFLSKYDRSLLGRTKMVFLFVEDAPPYAVVPVEIGGMTEMIGEQLWFKAVATWERCLNTNVWPSYTDGLIRVEASSWYINEHMGLLEQQQV